MNVLLKFDVDQMQYLFFRSFNEIFFGGILLRLCIY